MLGDEKRFRAWGQRALQRFKVLRASEEEKMVSRWLADPQANCELWGLRKAAKVAALRARQGR